MAPKLGDSQCPSRLEWQAGDGVWSRELSRGAWFAPGEAERVMFQEMQIVDTWFLPSTNTS